MNYPLSYEQLEIKLVLESKELRKLKEEAIGNQLKIEIKNGKDVIRSLRTADEKKDDDDQEETPDNFTGESFVS